MNEKITMNFKRRGYRPAEATPGTDLYCRQQKALKVHAGPAHDEFVEALCKIVARGLSRTIDHIKAAQTK